MALRDQPYIPLFIERIMTDEKLNECSASTHGIFIKGIMCLMHKSEHYGKILLKQKYKQNESTCLNFANQVAKHLPYSVIEISAALEELIREKVCHFEGDFLCQKRMIKDNETSLKKAESGRKGGLSNTYDSESKKQAPANYSAKAKRQAKRIIITTSITTTINSFIPKTWDRDEFENLIVRWGENRKDKKKPFDSILIESRLTELIEMHPEWDEAKKWLIEAGNNGWVKWCYPKDRNEAAAKNGSNTKSQIENEYREPHTDRA